MPLNPPSLRQMLCASLRWNGRCHERVRLFVPLERSSGGAKSAAMSLVPCSTVMCKRARVWLMSAAILLLSSLVRLTHKQALYFFERKLPESVRPELGRADRPGFASFQVLTRILRRHTNISNLSP